MGSTYAPALKDSLKTISYEEFIGILAGGKRDLQARPASSVMPAFGDNKNVMCYADDLYVYLKARASGAMPPRPPERQGREAGSRQEGREGVPGRLMTRSRTRMTSRSRSC